MATQANPPTVESVFAELQTLDPKWRVDIGRPEDDTGWIRGTDMLRADQGPFHALLERIGTRFKTRDRMTVAASFALRFGWVASVAIVPFLARRCVPHVGLSNISLKFKENTLFERIAIHEPKGTIAGGLSSSPLIHCVPDAGALLRVLRTELVDQTQPVVDALYQWSGFSRKGSWGMITSAWAAHFTEVHGRTGSQSDALPSILEFFGRFGRSCSHEAAAPSGDAEGRNSSLSAKGQLLSLLSAPAGRPLRQLPIGFRRRSHRAKPGIYGLATKANCAVKPCRGLHLSRQTRLHSRRGSGNPASRWLALMKGRRPGAFCSARCRISFHARRGCVCPTQREVRAVHYPRRRDARSGSAGRRLLVQLTLRLLPQWLRKAHESAGQRATVVCLVLACTDTQWWHEYVLPHAEICYLRGRLKFNGIGNSAAFPSAIAVFRPACG